MKNNKHNFLNTWPVRFLNSGKMFSSIPNDFEPIRKDLWSIEFPVEMGIDERFQVNAARPKVTNEVKEVKYKNLTFYYKGKTKTEPIPVEFRDAIGVSVYDKLEQWQREHTDFTTGKGGYAALYKKTVILNIEDPGGAVVQKFRLFGCLIQNLDGGDLSQDSDEIATVKLQLYYDNYRKEF